MTTKTTKKTKKNNNPLYVVKGKDVTPVNTILDFIVEKLGLAPIITFLQMMIETMLKQVSSYPAFVEFKKFMDQVVAYLSKFKFA